MADAADRLTLDAILRTDFPSFVAKVFATLNPGQSFDSNWYIEAIGFRLMQMCRGRSRRLIVNLPPRTLKSTIVSVAWCAWRLGHDPTSRIICASYGHELSVKFANDTRRIMEASWYRRIFPRTRIDRRKNSEFEFQTTRGGGRLAVSVGGALTGRGGDMLVIDDPLRAQDAMSAAVRDRTNSWFFSTALSRLDNAEKGEIVVVAQRLHVDDLCGRLLASSDGWVQLKIPARARASQRYRLGPARYHRFRAGDLLAPRRLGGDRLEAIRREMGSGAFAAQYLQEPRAPEGNLVKAEWLTERHDERLPKAGNRWRLLHSWDVAMTTGANGDYSVCTIWHFERDRAMLLDVVRVQRDFPSVRRLAIDLYERDRPEAVLVEAVGIGDALLQELKASGLAAKGMRPDGDKIVRLHRVLPMIETGSLVLPRDAPWLDVYLDELLTFPGVAHDDQVDSTTQALNWIRERAQRSLIAVGPICVLKPESERSWAY